MSRAKYALNKPLKREKNIMDVCVGIDAERASIRKYMTLKIRCQKSGMRREGRLLSPKKSELKRIGDAKCSRKQIRAIVMMLITRVEKKKSWDEVTNTRGKVTNVGKINPNIPRTIQTTRGISKV
jgi:hypothetical protein